MQRITFWNLSSETVQYRDVDYPPGATMDINGPDSFDRDEPIVPDHDGPWAGGWTNQDIRRLEDLVRTEQQLYDRGMVLVSHLSALGWVWDRDDTEFDDIETLEESLGWACDPTEWFTGGDDAPLYATPVALERALAWARVSGIVD